MGVVRSSIRVMKFRWVKLCEYGGLKQKSRPGISVSLASEQRMVWLLLALSSSMNESQWSFYLSNGKVASALLAVATHLVPQLAGTYGTSLSSPERLCFLSVGSAGILGRAVLHKSKTGNADPSPRTQQ